jgi:diguanylate cyclase (GGDEF)-like protein
MSECSTETEICRVYGSARMLALRRVSRGVGGSCVGNRAMRFGFAVSGRGQKDTRQIVNAHADISRRDDRIAELERLQRRLQHLYDISKLLTRFQTFERTVPEVVALIADTLPLRSAIFILETGAIPQMITWQAVGESAQRLRLAQVHAQNMYGYLMHSRVDLEREEATALEIQQQPASAAEQSEAANNFVMIPLALAHRSILGALQIEGSGVLEESDLFFIDAVVNQLATALDRHATDQALRASEARLEVANRELREALARGQLMARTDGLTGLNNRRYFFEAAAHEWAVAQRYGLPLALMLFDIDRFKQINDTVGHQMGDEILKRVARAAAERLRAADVLARYGGEEFIVLFPGSTAQQAAVAAESIREAIAADRIETRTACVVATISVGLADALHDQDTLYQLIQRADRALYRAKAKGRNCTEVDSPVT